MRQPGLFKCVIVMADTIGDAACPLLRAGSAKGAKSVSSTLLDMEDAQESVQQALEAAIMLR